MKTRTLFQIILILVLSCVSATAAVQRLSYNGNSAAGYARNNAWLPYTGTNRNPFYDFGNNCANFVSQSILAGIIGTTNVNTAYNRRGDFRADSTWYFISGVSNSGRAWRGANDLMSYANTSSSRTKGLHFRFLAADTQFNRSLNPLGLLPGDVIFCNWDGIGSGADHVVIVSRLDFGTIGLTPYNRIKIAGQSNPHTDTSLQYLIDQTYRTDRTLPTFRVYRPTDYTP